MEKDFHEETEIFDVLKNAVCCMMCVDGKMTESERAAIHKVLEKSGVPWHYDEVEEHIDDFLQISKKCGLTQIIEETCKKLSLFQQKGKEELLIQALNYVMYSDGKIKKKEIELCEKFKAELKKEIVNEKEQDTVVLAKDNDLAHKNADTFVKLQKKQPSGYELIISSCKLNYMDAPEIDKIAVRTKQEQTRLQIQKKCEEQQQEYIKLMNCKTEIDKMKPMQPCPDNLCEERWQLSESDIQDIQLYNCWHEYALKLIKWEDRYQSWYSKNPSFPPNSGYVCLNCGASDKYLKRYCFHGWKRGYKKTGPGDWSRGIKYTVTTTYKGLADFGGLICNRCALKRWIWESTLATVASALFLSIVGILGWYVWDLLSQERIKQEGLMSLFPHPSIGVLLLLFVSIILPFCIILAIIGLFSFFGGIKKDSSGARVAIKHLHKELEKQGYRYFGSGTVGQQFGGITRSIGDADTRMKRAIRWRKS